GCRRVVAAVRTAPCLGCGTATKSAGDRGSFSSDAAHFALGWGSAGPLGTTSGWRRSQCGYRRWRADRFEYRIWATAQRHRWRSSYRPSRTGPSWRLANDRAHASAAHSQDLGGPRTRQYGAGIPSLVRNALRAGRIRRAGSHPAPRLGRLSDMVRADHRGASALWHSVAGHRANGRFVTTTFGIRRQAA